MSLPDGFRQHALRVVILLTCFRHDQTPQLLRYFSCLSAFESNIHRISKTRCVAQQVIALALISRLRGMNVDTGLIALAGAEDIGLLGLDRGVLIDELRHRSFRSLIRRVRV